MAQEYPQFAPCQVGAVLWRHRLCPQQAAPKHTTSPDPRGHTAGQAGDSTDSPGHSPLAEHLPWPAEEYGTLALRRHKLQAYKLQLVQRLRRGDKNKRLRFCQWLLLRWQSRAFRKGFLMSDEAVFHLEHHKAELQILRSNVQAGAVAQRDGIVWRRLMGSSRALLL